MPAFHGILDLVILSRSKHRVHADIYTALLKRCIWCCWCTHHAE